VKYDGYRLRLERDGDSVRLITRGGYNWADRYPWIVEAALKNRHQQFVIDGEAVLLGVDGISDLNGLHSRQHDEDVQFYAFDILALDGEDLRCLPLSLRKTNLARLLARRPIEGLSQGQEPQASGLSRVQDQFWLGRVLINPLSDVRLYSATIWLGSPSILIAAPDASPQKHPKCELTVACEPHQTRPKDADREASDDMANPYKSPQSPCERGMSSSTRRFIGEPRSTFRTRNSHCSPRRSMRGASPYMCPTSL
jgi:hypothetical protein